MSLVSNFFSSRVYVFSTAFLLRFVLLVYGIHHDSVSALKYTDIDYYVFTDAARSLARGASPYNRATYRYTPLVAWILLPTTWGGLWFHFGKALFAVSDMVAGWMIMNLLQKKNMDKIRALKFASVWLLNPMVANISTRGSSEGLLCVLVMSLLWAFETRRTTTTGVLLGLSVHFKIYPFIYGTSMLWALGTETIIAPQATYMQRLRHFVNEKRITLAVSSVATFTILNLLMYSIYGPEFLKHTFWYHFTRIDHRHNFSPYNILLHLSSARSHLPATGVVSVSRSVSFESLAFLPQLLLSCVFIPISTSKIHFPATLLAQTLAFVTFNKVCTSQYFLWYLVFLPLYLPSSVFMARPRFGLTALGLWIAGQALWLQQGYLLEYLGRSVFVPGLWAASLLFLGINCWILGVVLQDVVVGTASYNTMEEKHPTRERAN